MLELQPTTARTLSHTGGYEAFPYAATNGTSTLALWRAAKAYGHADDDAAIIRGSRFDAASGAWSDATAQSGPPPGTYPTGLAWDSIGTRWVMLGMSRATGSMRSSLWASPSGGSWARKVDLAERWAWLFPSDLAIDGDLWVVTGYGALVGGGSTWQPIVTTTRDGGATWSTPTVPAGLPNFGEKGWSEPQVVKLPSGGWLMAIRNDIDYGIHLASSPDGLSWTYDRRIASDVSGEPEIAVTADGILVILVRRRPAKIEWHGEWAWLVSYDGGTSWARRDDFPSDGRFMLYGALAQSPQGLTCVFASEDDVTKPWESSSILVTTLERRDKRVELPDAPASVSHVDAQRAKEWQPAAWRFFATRLRGDGTETMLHPDLPLADVEPEFVLSGTSSLRATIPVEVANLTDAGLDVLVAWSTVIWIELDGRPRGAWILTDVEKAGSKLSLTGVGFTGFAKGTPYGGEKSFIDTDSLDVFRHVWEHIQAQPGANLGLTLESDKSGVLLGRQSAEKWPTITEGAKAALTTPGAGFKLVWTKTPAKPAVTTKRKVKGKVETKVTPAKPAVTETLYGVGSRDYPKTIPDGSTVIVRNRASGVVTRDLAGKGLPAGCDVMGVASKKEPQKDTEGEQLEPFTLAWYADADLGAKLDTICEQGNFDYVEEHSWDGDAPRHVLRFAAPLAGRVRDDLRFVVGENIVEAPALTEKAEQIATEVVVLGAGEGRAMVRGTWKATTPGRLRRVKTVTDKSLRTKTDADARAAREGKAATLGADIASIVVRDHPNAPLGSWGLGDTITARGDGQGWAGDWTMQLRIISYTLSPDKDTATLTVARGEVTT